MDLTVRLYPNAEVRATFFRSKSAKNYWTEDGEKEQGDRDREDDQTPPALLDITSKVSEGRVPGFGGIPRATKFGNNARRTISRCAGVFEVDGLFPDEFLLLTGTIPGSTKRSFDAMAAWSSWVVKTIKTWISDRGVKSAYSLYVWEFQKRGALHIHYCIHCPDVMTKVRLMREWKERWTEIIDGVGERANCDMWEWKKGGSWKNSKGVIQADAQVIRKSVGSYLSKYLSKNAPTIGGVNENKEEYHCPVRWWGCSRPLLKRMREITLEFRVEAIDFKEERAIQEKVREIVNWSANKVHSYWDKVKSSLTILTYDREDCETIFNHLKRDIYKWPFVITTNSDNRCQKENSEKDLTCCQSRESDLSKSAPGQKRRDTTSQLSLRLWSVTRAASRMRQKRLASLSDWTKDMWGEGRSGRLAMGAIMQASLHFG